MNTIVHTIAATILRRAGGCKYPGMGILRVEEELHDHYRVGEGTGASGTARVVTLISKI